MRNRRFDAFFGEKQLIVLGRGELTLPLGEIIVLVWISALTDDGRRRLQPVLEYIPSVGIDVGRVIIHFSTTSARAARQLIEQSQSTASTASIVISCRGRGEGTFITRMRSRHTSHWTHAMEYVREVVHIVVHVIPQMQVDAVILTVRPASAQQNRNQTPFHNSTQITSLDAHSNRTVISNTFRWFIADFPHVIFLSFDLLFIFSLRIFDWFFRGQPFRTTF